MELPVVSTRRSRRTVFMNFAATAGPKQFDLADAEDPEALDLAHSLGFTLWGLQPIFADAHNGRILQVGGIFFRD